MTEEVTAASPLEMAEWMLEELREKQWLYQVDTAHIMHITFGPSAVYLNKNGNYAIAKNILKEFKKLTGD